jgi:hypothetical protein
MNRQLLAVAFDAPAGAGRALREALAALANGHVPPVDACVAARGPGGALRAEAVAGIRAEDAGNAGWWHGLVQRFAAEETAEGVVPAAFARDVAAELAVPGRSVLLVAPPLGGGAEGDRLAAALDRHGRVLRGEIEDAEGTILPDDAGIDGHPAAFGSFP